MRKIKKTIENMIIRRKCLSGVTVIEMVLILVIKVLMHIECIESEKNLKNKLYTRYTQ